MGTRLYVVYDRLSEESGPVFQAKSDSVACRSVRKLFEEVEPYDRNSFQLLCLGTFDNPCSLSAFSTPEVVSLDFPKFSDAEAAQYELFSQRG